MLRCSCIYERQSCTTQPEVLAHTSDTHSVSHSRKKKYNSGYVFFCFILSMHTRCCASKKKYMKKQHSLNIRAASAGGRHIARAIWMSTLTLQRESVDLMLLGIFTSVIIRRNGMYMDIVYRMWDDDAVDSRYITVCLHWRRCSRKGW